MTYQTLCGNMIYLFIFLLRYYIVDDQFLNNLVVTISFELKINLIKYYKNKNETSLVEKSERAETERRREEGICDYNFLFLEKYLKKSLCTRK